MNYSETKRISIRHKCPPFGVLLIWLNPFNNYETWLFDGRTTRVTDSGEEILFTGADERTDEVLLKSGSESLTLRAMNFTKGQAMAFKHLFTSPKVIANVNGQWLPVRVAAGTFTSVDEVVKRQNLQFDVILPKLNSLTQ